MREKISQIQVGVKASLIVEKETAMAALALVRLYCKATGSEIVKNKDEKGEVTYCLMGAKEQKQDIRRGHWQESTEVLDNTGCGEGRKITFTICSICGEPLQTLQKTAFCPHCGTKMDLEET